MHTHIINVRIDQHYSLSELAEQFGIYFTVQFANSTRTVPMHYKRDFFSSNVLLSETIFHLVFTDASSVVDCGRDDVLN